MKKLLFVLTLALLPVQAWAQGTVTKSLASTTCAVDGCLALGVEGYGSASVQLIVTGTAVAIVEGSVNGTDFRSIQIGASDGSGNVTSVSATGMWYVNVAGMSQVRVRLTTCTSCTVVGHIQATRSGGGAGGSVIGGGDATAANQSTGNTSLASLVAGIQGKAASGSAVSGNPLLMAGRASAAAPTAVGADGNVVSPWLFRTGNQAVTIVNSDGTIPTISTDATHGSAVIATGNQFMGEAATFSGSALANAVTAGQAARAKVTPQGVQYVTQVNPDGSTVGHVIVDSGGGGGTQYTQNVALTVASTIGTQSMGRASAAAPTDVGSDDRAVMPWYLRSGAQAVQQTYAGVFATTGNGVSGTGVPRVTIASDSTGSLAVTNAGTFATQVTSLLNTLGSTTSGQSGVLGQGAVTTSAPTYTNAQTNALSLQTDGSLRVALTNGGGGGTSLADRGTFTVGTTNYTPAGGIAEAASPTNCAEGKACTAAVTLNRAVKVALFDTSGAALTPSQDRTQNAASAGGETGPLMLVERRDAPTAGASANGNFAYLSSNTQGALWVSQVDPCSSENKVTAPFSLTARGVVISATSSKKNYVCAITVVAGAAEVFNLVEGTGTTCQTGTAAVVGSTTAANGLSFAANGGFAAIGANSSVMAGLTANVDSCIVPSGSNRLAGFVTYVQR